MAACALAGCAQPPDATFTVSPAGQHVTGDVLTFRLNTGCSPLDTTQISWDLDGDGSFETVGPGNCSYSQIGHSYERPGAYTVSSNVGITSLTRGIFVWLRLYSSQQVVVGARPDPGGQPSANRSPTADFVSDASPGYTERTVHFDASTSSDPDGRIVKYEWDFTSDGTWDATGVTASYAYPGPNEKGYQATLRVTDDQGATATTVRAVPVVDGVPPSESLADGAVAAAATRGAPFQSTLSGSVTSPGQGFINGGALSSIGVAARGTMRLRGLPKPLSGKRSARWAARFTTRQRGNSDRARLAVEGHLLLDLGRGDRVCFSGRVAGRLDQPFAGRLGVTGGSGRGLRVRGGATLTVPLTGKSVGGRLNLAGTRKTRKLPRVCRSLVRLLPRA
jgi:hypothetical protein